MFDVIALDLDGTLLKNDKTVSEKTIETLKKYEELGKQIVIKLNSLRYILNELGTSIDRVMFFGDDVNDIELIKECGIGVAMGNAVEKVKDIANYLTSTNEEDGIAVFLNQL